ncbi:DUF2478 domain-containing protein [Candidatus Halocynthiibacter alkanivorans]|jgi:nucleoside-triphosphatase THEP1|uniref:DUF2478 domain-containing protein n=1 Tax=Candidatus Halocynthiibacter alkanivorans TaxID=2267619 RepID=UPI000DF22E44|nr:DUF2478 domain-containing protein [Candidatus Halocynthiibacter alkanivorans]
MDIAYITTTEQGKTDTVLAEVAGLLALRGLQLAGVVQTNSDSPDCRGCDMDVRVLPDGPTIRISQSLGKEARGCKLDPSALEEAVVEVQSRLNADSALLILNKFGKHEADGRGFRDLIAEALSLGLPVVTAVNQMNEAAFLEFSGGLAIKLPTSAAAIVDWATDKIAGRSTAA